MKSIIIRVTEEEKIKLMTEAEKLNISMNRYIKNIISNNLEIITQKIKLEEELKNEYKDLSYQIRQIGINLNQINRNFYEGKSIKIEEIKELLEELWQLIKL
ncbi:plasmid mobilization protein [Fusobacterium gastrosuis]|uniref:plasmid mobilization protein n=1 Tax=Fusobacterium gastrosuis TaxID=1755100 RepID=UPI002976AEBF|nr:CopG family transcriptional regulator [Fusobacteriaceae bacterium]MDY5714276.1 CopG family transcriptional regulator [Fusobacterium gastrosuis]